MTPKRGTGLVLSRLLAALLALSACNGGTTPGNKAPIANDDNASTLQDQAVGIDALANDTDPDGDTLSVSSFEARTVQGGGVGLAGGQLNYAPKAGFSGTDTFHYTISDGKGGSDTATVTIVVSKSDPNNEPPTIAAVSDRTVIRSTLKPRTVELELEIQDPDDDRFTVLVDSDDEEVLADTTLSCGLEPCLLTLAPFLGKTVHVTLALTVSDGGGGKAETSFVVNVVPRLVKTTLNNDPNSLRAVVERAEPGDVIGFDTAGAFATPQTLNLLQQVVLETDLTIEGPGADRLTISGGDTVRVFKVTGGASVVIGGLTVADGKAPVETVTVGGESETTRIGGGIFVASGSTLIFQNGVVRDSEAGEYGGGIGSLEGAIIVTDGSRVIGNTAGIDGGGVLNVFGSTLIENSVVGGLSPEEANHAGFGGGGINNYLGTLTLRASQIVGNSAVKDGGGISNGGTLEITNSEISGNSAGEGGEGSGGGISNGGTLEITGSEIAGNSAGEGGEGSGGGIYNTSGGTLTLRDSEISGNAASGDGGGLYHFQGIVTIETSVIGDPDVTDRVAEGNTAEFGAGIYVFLDSTLTIRDSRIVGNHARSGTGGIRANGSLTLRSSQVSGNAAPRCGGIWSTDVATIENSLIGDPDLGDGVDEGNTGTDFGGGLCLFGDSTLSNTIVAGNRTDGDGGGIYQSGLSGMELSQTTIDDSTVHGNSATRGGGIANDGGTLEITDSAISGNAASKRGGGLYIFEQGTATIAASVIGGAERGEGNTANLGGGIANLDGTVTLESGGQVVGNVASAGGGVYNRAEGTLTLEAGSSITRNTATDDSPSGGGVNNFGTLNNNGDISGNTPDNVVNP